MVHACHSSIEGTQDYPQFKTSLSYIVNAPNQKKKKKADGKLKND